MPRFIGWVLLLLITVLSLLPHFRGPMTGLPRLLEHAAIFGAAGFAFGVGYSIAPRS